MRYVYKCTRPQCREFAKEVIAMSPSDARFATGRPVTCSVCGDVLRLMRQAPEAKA